jgi:hypothetical protein
MALADSSGPAQAADAVLATEETKDQKGLAPNQTRLLLHIVRQRHGPSRKQIRLLADFAACRIEEEAVPQKQPEPEALGV